MNAIIERLYRKREQCERELDEVEEQILDEQARCSHVFDSLGWCERCNVHSSNAERL